MMNKELIQKHIRRLIEVTTNVRAQVRTSKKGKKFNVKAHDRDLKNMSNAELARKFNTAYGSEEADPIRKEFDRRGITGLKLRKLLYKDMSDKGYKYYDADVTKRREKNVKAIKKQRARIQDKQDAAAYKARQKERKFLYGK